MNSRIQNQTVATAAQELASELGDEAAVKLIQRALGVGATGVLCARTARAINERPAAAVLTAIRIATAQYYRQLVDRRPELEPQLAGWIERLSRSAAGA